MDGDGKVSSLSPDHSNCKKSDEDTISTSSVEPAPFRYVFKHEKDDVENELDAVPNTANSLDEDITTPSCETSQELNFDETFLIADSSSKTIVSPLHEVSTYALSSPSKDANSNDIFERAQVSEFFFSNAVDANSQQSLFVENEIAILQDKIKVKDALLFELQVQNEELRHQITTIAHGDTSAFNADNDKIVSELKLQIAKKDSEIDRLSIMEKNLKQTKQILKDTTWALRVKEEELLNIKTDMRENYEKRLRELMQRLNDQEYKMGMLQSKNNELIEKDNDSILRVDELSQQVYLLNQELEMRDKLAHVSEREKENSTGEYKSQINFLSQQVQELTHQLQKYETDFDKESLRMQELTLKLESLQANSTSLESLVEKKSLQIKLLEESQEVAVQNLQNELFKSQSHVKELVLLLEGVSTNSDMLPTGQVDETANVSTDLNFLLKRTKNYLEVDSDSFGSVDDIQSEELLSQTDGDSVKQQINHTISKYEQQIIDLQNLYDQDMSQLNTEKEHLLKEIQELKAVLNKANQSKEISIFEKGELHENYKEQISEMKKNFEATLEHQKKSSAKMIDLLQSENDRLQQLVHDTQKKFDNTVAGLEIIHEQSCLTAINTTDCQESVAEIEQQLQQQITDIKSQYDNQLTSLEIDFRREKEMKSNELENNFSSQFLHLQEEKVGLAKKVASLEAELNVVQHEYDDLKDRYSLVDEENDRLKEKVGVLEVIARSIDSKNSLNLNGNISENFKGADENKNVMADQLLDSSENDVLIKSNVLHNELVRLRKNFNDAKVEIENLRNERNKFATLSDALSQNLQELQVELEFNNSKSLLPDLNSTIKEVEQLKQDNSILVQKLNLNTPIESLPGFSSEHMIQEVTLQPLFTESNPVDFNEFPEGDVKSNIGEQEYEETIFDQLENLNLMLSEKTENEKKLSEEIERLNKFIESHQESKDDKTTAELRSQLERSEQLSNHLQEMFSIQLMKLQEENKELSNDVLVFKQKLEKQKQLSEEKAQLELLLESEKVSASKVNQKLLLVQQKLQEEQASFLALKEELEKVNQELNIKQEKEKKVINESMQYQLELAEIKERLAINISDFNNLKVTVDQKNERIEQLSEELKLNKEDFKRREDTLKQQYEDILSTSKEAMSITNSECLSKLRSELYIDHQQRLKASEDMLHEEYTKRIKELSDMKEAELVDLKSDYETQLADFTSNFSAEKEKQMRTLRTVLERNHSKEIQELLSHHNSEIEALQKHYSEETEKIVLKLHNDYSTKIVESEKALTVARVEEFESLKFENDKLINKQLEDLRKSLHEEFKEQSALLENQHKKEIDEISKRYLDEYEIKLAQNIEELNLQHEDQLEVQRVSLNEIFEIKLASELEKAANELKIKHMQNLEDFDKDLQQKHEANISKIMSDIHVEHEKYVQARIDEVVSQHNCTIQMLKESCDASIKKSNFETENTINELKIDHSKILKELTKLYEEEQLELIESKKMLEEKSIEMKIFHETHDSVVNRLARFEEEFEKNSKEVEIACEAKFKAKLDEMAAFYEELVEKKLEETENNYKLSITKSIEEKDLEAKMLHNALEELALKNESLLSSHQLLLEEKIAQLKSQYDELRSAKDMEIMNLLEKLEERRSIEEELHLKVSKLKQKNTFQIDELKISHEQQLEQSLNDLQLELTKEHKNKIKQLKINHSKDIEKLKFEQNEEILILRRNNELKKINGLAELHTKLVLKQAMEIEKLNFNTRILLEKEANIFKKQIKEMSSTVEHLKLENNKLISEKLIEKYDKDVMTEEDFNVQKALIDEISELNREILSLQMQVEETANQFSECDGNCEFANKLKNTVEKTQQELETFQVSHNKELDKMKNDYDCRIKKVEEQVEAEIKSKLKLISDEKIQEFQAARDDLFHQQQSLLNEFVKQQESEMTQLQCKYEEEVQDLKSKLQCANDAKEKVLNVAAIVTKDISTNTDDLFHNDVATIEASYRNQLCDMEQKMASALIENEEFMLNKHLQDLTDLEKNMELKHWKKLQELERIAEENIEEQRQLLLEQQKKHATDLENIEHKNFLTVHDLNEKHNRLLLSMQKDFELKTLEQINAVVANMEVETDRIKDELLAVHEQELDDLKKEIELLTVKLATQERHIENLSKDHEEFYVKVQDQHQVELLQLKESLKNHYQKELIELENSVAGKIKEDSHEKLNVEKKQLMDELTEKEIIIKQLNANLLLAENYEQMSEDRIKGFEKDIVQLQHEKVQLQEKVELKDNEINRLAASLREVNSQNELMFERHDRQEQESSNLVIILQSDIIKLTKERNDLTGVCQQLRKSLNNLLASILNSEENIHKKLDEMIMSNLSSSILPENLFFNIKNGRSDSDNSANTTLALQNDITSVDEAFSEPVLITQDGNSLAPDDAEGFFSRAELSNSKVNIQDPEQLKDVGEHLFVVVDHLLQMFSATVGELNEVRNVFSETQSISNNLYADLEIKKDQLLNLQSENNNFVQQLEEYDSEVNELKSNIALVNEKNNSLQVDIKDLTELNNTLESKLKLLNIELWSANERVAESSREILTSQQDKQSLEIQWKECKEKLKEKELELELTGEKLSNLLAENKQLMDEKNAKEIKFADLKMELENDRYTRKQEELAVSKRASKAAFMTDEEKENLKHEIESLNEIIRELTEEKQELRSQMLDSGYSHKEDSLHSEITKMAMENDELVLSIQKLQKQVHRLEGALQEALDEKQQIESTFHDINQARLKSMNDQARGGGSLNPLVLDFNGDAAANKANLNHISPIKDLLSSTVGNFSKNMQSTVVAEQKKPVFTHGSPILMDHPDHQNLSTVKLPILDEVAESKVNADHFGYVLSDQDVHSLQQVIALVESINQDLSTNTALQKKDQIVEPIKAIEISRLKEKVCELHDKVSELLVSHAHMIKLSLQQKEDIDKFADHVTHQNKENKDSQEEIFTIKLYKKEDSQECATSFQEKDQKTFESLKVELASSDNKIKLLEKETEKLGKEITSMREELRRKDIEGSQQATLIKDLEVVISDRDRELKEVLLKHRNVDEEKELFKQQRIYVAELEACLKETQFVLNLKNEELSTLKSWFNEKRPVLDERKSVNKTNIFELQSQLQTSQVLIDETTNYDFWQEDTDNQTANQTVHERLMNLLQRQKHLQDETVRSLTDKDVKYLLNDIQSEAEEVLNLVLSIPELNEALSLQNLQRHQNAWLTEKNCLLAVIKSLKDLVVKVNSTNILAPESFIGDRRIELVNAIADLFEKEQEAVSAEYKLNDQNKENQPVTEISTSLSALLSKDRELLVDEIKNLRSALNENSCVPLNNQIDELKREVVILNTQVDHLKDNLEKEKLARKELNIENSEKLEKLNELTAQILQYQQSSNEARMLLQEEISQSNHLKKLLEDAENNIISLHNLVQSERESLNNLLDQDSSSVNELEKLLESEMEKRVSLEARLADLKQLLEKEQSKVKAIESELSSEIDNKFYTEKLLHAQKLKIAEMEQNEHKLELKLAESLSKQKTSFQMLSESREFLQTEDDHLNEIKSQPEARGETFLKEKILSLEKAKIDLQGELEENAVLLKTYEKNIRLLEAKLTGCENILSVKEADLEKLRAEFGKIIKLNEREVRNLRDEIKQLKFHKPEENRNLVSSALEKEWSAREKALHLREKALIEKESKLDEVMLELEKENNLLLERQRSQEDIEQAIMKRKSEIERLAEEMRHEKIQKRHEIIADKSAKDSLNREHDQLKENIHRLEHKISFYRQQDAKNQELHDFWEKERDHLHAQIEQLKVQRDKIENKRCKLSEKVVDLKEKLAFLKKKTDKSNQMHLKKIEKLQDEIKTLKERTTYSPEITEDGRKLLNAGWTIAKVQRLYLKYFRAESFRKALSYQKTYFLLLLSEYGNGEQLTLNKFVGRPERFSLTRFKKFKIVALVIISVVRMKFLKLKYQRNLYKSSAKYPYKDRKEKKLHEPKTSHQNNRLSNENVKSTPMILNQEKQSFSKTSSDEKTNISKSLDSKFSSYDQTLRNNAQSKSPNEISQNLTNDSENSTENIVSPLNINDTSPASDSKNLSNTPRYVGVNSYNLKSSFVTQSQSYSPHMKPPSDAPRSYPRPSPTHSDFALRHTSPPVRDVDSDGSNIYIPQTLSMNKDYVEIYARPNQHSSTSLNQYIRKLESLQTRLKEQSTRFDKNKSNLVNL